MIDMPQVPPPAYEQVVMQKLLECGLRKGGFTAKYEDELQSVEIVIDKEAGASAEHIECIRQAAGYEIVAFKDPELQKAYEDRVFEVLRPKILADAQAELEKHNILAGFPERSRYGSDKLFAEALERQCGMNPGSFFVQGQSGLIIRPEADHQSAAEQKKLSCLMAAITYLNAKGEGFKLGFIGNEAFVPGK